MRRPMALARVAALALAVPATVGGQELAQAPPDSAPPVVGPPVRRIATASAVSKVPIGVISGVRELPDGRVLLNDGERRRLVVLDTMLAVAAVVLDSAAEVENTYGTRAGTLVPFRGDTTLLIDPASFVMMVIDPAGKLVRVRSVWRVQDMGYVTGFSQGMAAADARGRIVYRVPAQAAPPKVRPPRGVPWIPQPPDSAFIVAVDIDTRKVDTLGAIRTPKQPFSVRMRPGGMFDFLRVFNPLPVSDDWAVLPDGTVAFVRARDYRIDYLEGDGRWTSSPKLPYAWQRLSEADRQRLVDSVKAAQERSNRADHTTSLIRWVNNYRKEYPAGFRAPEGYRLPQGLPRGSKLPEGLSFPERYIYGCAPDEEPKMLAPSEGMTVMPAPGGPPGGPPGAPSGTPSCIPQPVAGTNAPEMPRLRDVLVVPADELPDYRPPLSQSGVTRADMDGNLWIRVNPARPTPGGPVYDVVSRGGALVDRIQIPRGYSLVGFGRGRVVFLSMADAQGMHLARVRLR